MLILLMRGESDAALSASPAFPTVGQNVLFTVTGCETAAFCSPAPFFTVIFGDGGSATTPICSSVCPAQCSYSVSHAYATAGTYNVSATVTPFGACGIGGGTAIVTVCEIPVIITSSLSAGLLWRPYSGQLLNSGGIAPITYSVLAGALPPGLTLSPSGLISGTPTSEGLFGVTIKACPSAPCAAACGNLPLTMSFSCPTVTDISITTSSPLAAARVGQSYSSQIQASAGIAPFIYSIYSGTLPPGLTLSSAGTISGTPTAAGTYNFAVKVQFGAPCSDWTQVTYALTVNPPLPLTITAAPNPALINQPVNVTVGGITAIPCSLNFDYGDGSNANVTCMFSPCAATIPSHSYSIPGSYTLKAVPYAPCGTTGVGTLTVICPALAISTSSPLAAGTAGQAYSAQIQASGGQSPVTFSVVSGALPPGLTLGPTGLISGIPTAAGSYSFTARVQDSCPGGGQTVQKTFSLSISPASCAALNVITASPLATGTVGQGYSSQLQNSGGVAPITYALSGGALPPGLTLGPTGLISGIPTAAGGYSFTVAVTDSCSGGAQSVQKSFNMTISPASCAALNVITASPLANGMVGQAYSALIKGSGGQFPITFSLVAGSLPPGLSMTSSGLISGVPIAAGSYTFTVALADSCSWGAQNVQKTFLMTVSDVMGLSLTVTPAFMSIPRGTATSGNISYVFSGTPSVNATLQSNNGTFLAGGSVVGESSVPLSVTVVNGVGRVSEPLIIPVAVSERAERMGLTRITYVRNFTGGGNSLTASIELGVTTAAGSQFTITRIRLYFENNRPEITVKRDQPSVNAHAEISFIGSGLLQGYWEVDGRIISNINRNFIYGESVILTTPPEAPLPTFDEGSHIVRFVITNPQVGLSLPEALYFVSEEEWQKIKTIKLIAPADGSTLDYAPVDFSWDGGGLASAYLIEFSEEGIKKPVFSAYAKKRDYLLPEAALKSAFSPDKKYLWRVKGLDVSGIEIDESRSFSFSFKESTSYLPGQILLVVDASKKGSALADNLVGRFNFSLVEESDIMSLGMKMYVVSTKEDIFKQIEAISKEDGVVLAQPNYIFSTLAETLRTTVGIPDTFHLKKVHKLYKGQGVVVAVIDTGVDAHHEGLRGSVAYSENLIKDSPFAAEVHGTAVAGIIASDSEKHGMKGIAPEAQVLALRACRQASDARPEGECCTSSIARAIDAALAKKAKIVNMSFGSASQDRMITKLIEAGSRTGALFVAPSGNSVLQRELRFPASLPAVVAVAGLDDKGNPYPNKEIASKSKVCAPALNIFTTVPGDKYNFLSGTSMSSAEVSGLLALASEKNRELEIGGIPQFKGSLCKWEEDLLKMPLCEK
jgi:hypothetical protein